MKALPIVDEINSIVFSMSIDSAPGQDGFGVGFYQLLENYPQRFGGGVQAFFKGASNYGDLQAH